MSDTRPSYPLSWPEGYPRTPSSGRKRGTFRIGASEAQAELREEVTRLGADDLIVSSNVRVKPNGFPYATDSAPADPGVAIYFQLNGKPQAMACDAYDAVGKNVRALALCIAALRSLERHGSSSLLERAFRGFAALPATTGDGWAPWTEVLQIPYESTSAQAEEAYRKLLLVAHPDKPGGSESAFRRLRTAWQEALGELAANGR